MSMAWAMTGITFIVLVYNFGFFMGLKWRDKQKRDTWGKMSADIKKSYKAWKVRNDG